MIYELNNDGIRSYGLAMANRLEGPWKRVTDRYATVDQLDYVAHSDQWTGMVSHGEVIRTGYDQFMEYDPAGVRWIIQGIMTDEMSADYPSLPWKHGIIRVSGAH